MDQSGQSRYEKGSGKHQSNCLDGIDRIFGDLDYAVYDFFHNFLLILLLVANWNGKIECSKLALAGKS